MQHLDETLHSLTARPSNMVEGAARKSGGEESLKPALMIFDLTPQTLDRSAQDGPNL